MGEASAATLDALVVANLAVVRGIARRLKRRLPDQIPLSELIAVGYLALTEVARRFQVRKGVPFDAFIRRRIYGAMIDALRQGTPMTRRDLRVLREQRRTTEAYVMPPFRLVQLDDGRRELPAPDPDPEVCALQAERRRALRRAVRTLGWRDRQILISSFFDERTLAAIGIDHHIGESRVSQLRTAALHTLRRAMTGAAH